MVPEVTNMVHLTSRPTFNLILTLRFLTARRLLRLILHPTFLDHVMFLVVLPVDELVTLHGALSYENLLKLPRESLLSKLVREFVVCYPFSLVLGPQSYRDSHIVRMLTLCVNSSYQEPELLAAQSCKLCRRWYPRRSAPRTPWPTSSGCAPELSSTRPSAERGPQARHRVQAGEVLRPLPLLQLPLQVPRQGVQHIRQRRQQLAYGAGRDDQ